MHRFMDQTGVTKRVRNEYPGTISGDLVCLSADWQYGPSEPVGRAHHRLGIELGYTRAGGRLRRHSTMSVHVSVSVPAEHFVLQQFPEEVRIELERCVPFDGEPTPYLWVAGNDESRHVEDRPAFRASSRLHRPMESDWFARSGDPDTLTCSMRSVQAIRRLSGFRERNMWNLTLRFPSAESVSEWYRACPESGNHVTVRRVQTGEPPRTARAARLTDPQRETLRIALETGYFAVPRQISLGELSDRQEISDVAVSQRLRRGSRASSSSASAICVRELPIRERGLQHLAEIAHDILIGDEERVISEQLLVRGEHDYPRLPSISVGRISSFRRSYPRSTTSSGSRETFSQSGAIDMVRRRVQRRWWRHRPR